MLDRRIQSDKDKQSFINELCDADSHKQLFRSMADCLVFAASYGYEQKRRRPLTQVAPNPIRYSVFENGNYGTFIHLLAMKEEKDAHVLADSDDMVEKRAAIFEEYANGGLELLRNELSSSVDSLEPILLLLKKQREKNDGTKEQGGGFDLTQLEL